MPLLAGPCQIADNDTVDTKLPAPQGVVPRTHQAHQDQLGIPLAEPVLKAVYWSPGPAASGSLGLA